MLINKPAKVKILLAKAECVKQANRTLFLKGLVLLMQTLDISHDSLLHLFELLIHITLAVPCLALSGPEAID